LEKQTAIESGVLFEDVPREFKEYFDYVFKLKFEDTPDYNRLRRIMKELFFSKGYDYNFDWQVDDEDNEFEENSELTKDSSLQIHNDASTLHAK